MKKTLSLTSFIFLCAIASQAYSQSIRNTQWKAFIPSLNDTIKLTFLNDSSQATNGFGDILMRSLFSTSGEKITLKDYEGQIACLNFECQYSYHQKDSTVIFSAIQDPCNGRVEALDGVMWSNLRK